MLRMYTLCLAGIIGLGLGAAGCSGSSHHPAGNFGLRWSLAWTTGGGTTCSAAGATEVDLDLVDTFNNYGTYDRFICSDYQGTSESLQPDDYTVAVKAYDATGVLLSEWDSPVVYSIYAGRVTQLPDVVLQVK